MLYTRNKKIYVKVSEKFIPVNIKKDKNGEYNVVTTDDEVIEAYGNADTFSEISIDEAYEMLAEKNFGLRNKKLDDEKLRK